MRRFEKYMPSLNNPQSLNFACLPRPCEVRRPLRRERRVDVLFHHARRAAARRRARPHGGGWRLEKGGIKSSERSGGIFVEVL